MEWSMARKKIMILPLILVVTKFYVWKKICQHFLLFQLKGIISITIFCNLHETLKLMMHLAGYFLDRQVGKTGAA